LDLTKWGKKGALKGSEARVQGKDIGKMGKVGGVVSVGLERKKGVRRNSRQDRAPKKQKKTIDG